VTSRAHELTTSQTSDLPEKDLKIMTLPLWERAVYVALPAYTPVPLITCAVTGRAGWTGPGLLLDIAVLVALAIRRARLAAAPSAVSRAVVLSPLPSEVEPPTDASQTSVITTEYEWAA
jgi:hypothetical protein